MAKPLSIDELLNALMVRTTERVRTLRVYKAAAADTEKHRVNAVNAEASLVVAQVALNDAMAAEGTVDISKPKVDERPTASYSANDDDCG